MEQLTTALLEEKIKLVLDSLMNLGNPDFLQGENAVQVDSKRGIYARDFGIEHWDWPQGVGLYGLEKLQAMYGDSRYDGFLVAWFERNFKQGMPSRNVNTTAPYLALLALAQRTKSPVYEQMCKECADWLVYSLPKTNEGGFQHVTSSLSGKDGIILNDSELWVDTLFMAVLFLAKAGVVYQNEVWISESIKQILIHIKYLYEKQTGLFYHGWSFNRNDNFGGIFWCRGNSWFTYGILELIETLDGKLDSGITMFLTDTLKAQINALQGLQAENGLWHTVLTDSTSYEETSGTAAIAAAIYKAVRLGILDTSFLPCAQKAMDGILSNIDTHGIVHNVSSGTGMGLDAAHYKNIITAPISYGQSMTAFALIEALYSFNGR